MHKSILFTCLSFVILACNEPPNSNNRSKSGIQKSATTTVSFLKGVYYFDPARSVFKHCKDMADYTVVDQTDSLEGKYIELLPFRHEKEPVYVELSGYVNSQQDTLFVTNLQQISLLNIKAACFAPVFQCSGTEPFWFLTIHPELNLLIFRDYSNMESHLFDYQAPVKKGTKSVYKAKSVGGEMIEVVISKEKCSDGMSDLVYDYKAEISFRDQQWKGCAVQ
jgi:uncharacterized membrane protein